MMETLELQLETAAKKSDHLPALDGVRGVAALLVVTLHFGVVANFPGPTNNAIGRIIQRVLFVGWSGVDLFLVLSGFLITRILLTTKDRPRALLNFYGRRTLRIFPLYFIALGLGLYVLPLLGPGITTQLLGDATAHQGWLWTYTSNLGTKPIGPVASFGIFSHFWTLAIEEQFYAVWPWVVRGASRRSLLKICVTCVAGAPLFRCVWIASGRYWGGAYHFTLARVDALAIGGALAALTSQQWQVVARWAPAVLRICLGFLAVLFALINPFYPSHWAVVTIGHSVLAITFAAWIVTAITSPPSWLQWRWLRAWGTFGYGVYVWHWPIHELLIGPYQRIESYDATLHFVQASVFLATGIVISFVAGWLSYRLIERHFLQLKCRLPNYPSAAAG